MNGETAVFATGLILAIMWILVLGGRCVLGAAVLWGAGLTANWFRALACPGGYVELGLWLVFGWFVSIVFCAGLVVVRATGLRALLILRRPRERAVHGVGRSINR